MGASLATLACIIGIACLFFLDRNKSVATSKALWLPVIWFWIVGSRPVSMWLGVGPTNIDTATEGSPLDRFVFQVLLGAGVIVLLGRKSRTKAFLKASWPVLIYFGYCLLSVLWSDFPDIAFKRWIKAIGDLVMVLIVLTDVDIGSALGRIVTRTGFILMPTSVLFIRYFDNLGRGYDPDGVPMNTGVTTNKNVLGVVTLVIALGALWWFLNAFVAKGQPRRFRQLLSRGSLLAFCVTLLVMAQSATAVGCFILGATLILATYLPFIKRRPSAVHALIALIIIIGGITLLFGGHASVVHALGRQTGLTGRVDIWAAVLPVVPNSLLGAGFESFWLGPRLDQVYSRLSQYMHVNEAHNGYIEVYLNLGWIGVIMIAVILITGYWAAVAAFRRNSALGSLMLAYVATAVIYSISEAGFRLLNPIWIFLLLAVVGAHGISSGASDGTGKLLRTRARRAIKQSNLNELPLGQVGVDN